MPGRYDDLSREELIRLLERRDARQPYGLLWERERIEPDQAFNDDFVVLDRDPALSTTAQDAAGWRNLVIEGDNWDVLRALRLAYAARVNCIIIDPPYNTGNKDFTYNDRFIGKEDRFRHSLWLEFLYRRLVLARDLLADDGVILVCINDENRARLDLLMEQVFPGMRLGSFVWRTKDTNNSDKRRNWSGVHEHILVYANPGFAFRGGQMGAGKFRRRPEFGEVPVRLDPITKAETFKSRANTYYPIRNPTTGLWYPCAPNQVWRFWSETQPPRGRARLETSMEALIRAGDIYFPPETASPFFFPDRAALDTAIARGDVPRDGRGRPLLRADLPDLNFWVGKPIAHGRLSRIVRWTPELAATARPVGSWIAGLSEDAADVAVETLRSERQGAATTLLEHMFGAQVFPFPKPLSLLRALVRACSGEDDLVLDFFAGAGTTAHAVLAQNAEDDATRRFIMVSNTEATTDEPDKNLCRDVCARRLRLAIDGYGDTPGLGGDFAYLRARRIAQEDLIYELDPPAVWTLLQLRQGFPLRPFDPEAPVQLAASPDDSEREALAYVPTISGEAVSIMVGLAGAVLAFTPTPGLLRDAVDRPGLAVERLPDRLIGEFLRTAAGL